MKMESDDEVMNTEPCSICNMKSVNEVEYGEFLTRSEITVHYYCLLFATNLQQLGTNDRVGINRYRLMDIRRHIQKYDKIICTYCSAEGAAVYCTVKRCTNVFHVICGLKNKCHFEFTGLFKTYCHSHNLLAKNIKYKTGKSGCCLCFTDLRQCDPARVIPSCNLCKIGYFHASCLKKYALNAGYDFMCPTCKNKDYRKEAPLLGIYVPDRMALWETPEVISSTQYAYQCDASECKCPSGCKTNTDSWPMIICEFCGTFGIHRQCSDNPIDNYVCQSCKYSLLDESEASQDIELPTQKIKLDERWPKLVLWKLPEVISSTQYADQCDASERPLLDVSEASSDIELPTKKIKLDARWPKLVLWKLPKVISSTQYADQCDASERPLLDVSEVSPDIELPTKNTELDERWPKLVLWKLPEVISSTQYADQCDASECKCPSGCKTNTDSWPMISCDFCGTFGIHRECFDNLFDNYVCQSCKYSLLDESEASPDIELPTVSSGPLYIPKSGELREMELDDEVLNTKPCSICHMQTVNEVEYGEFLTRSEITVHYYCLVFATKLPQLGENHQDGINRYRLMDIRRHIQKYDRIICTYCSAKGAAVYCTVKSCTNVFHVICGLKNKCHFEFTGLFKTYCHSHNPLVISMEYKTVAKTCCFCDKDLSQCHPTRVIPSCSTCRVGFLHANCMKKYALNAGFDFMCPTCGNKDFRPIMAKRVLRELPEEVYPSIQFTYQCFASECKCPSGCKTNTDSWPMLICKYCETFAIHRQCSDKSIDNYICEPCKCELMDVSESSWEVESLAENTEFDDEIETITVSSGPLCIPKKFMDHFSKDRLTMFLNRPIVNFPIDPWMPEELWEQWEEHWTN